MDGVGGKRKQPTSSASPSTKKTRRTATQHSAVHSAKQRSKTLMRRTVTKPKTGKANISNVVGETDAPINTPSSAEPSPVLFDASRLRRVKHIKQSKLITRFSAATASLEGTVNKHIKPLAVRAHPSQASVTKTVIGADVKRSAPKKAHPKHHDMFEKAMQNATSHNQPKPKKAPVHHRAAKKLHMSPKVANTTALLLSIALVGSFFAYQNVSNLSMKVAAARAGFNADLPSYSPAGFSLNRNIKYSTGEVLVSYSSNSDAHRNFTFSQRESAWNSQDLLSNYVEIASTSWQTFLSNGNTIYIYDNDNATWVSGGIWYEVEGESALNTDQLLRIADSI